MIRSLVDQEAGELEQQDAHIVARAKRRLRVNNVQDEGGHNIRLIVQIRRRRRSYQSVALPMVERPGEARNENVLKNASAQVLRQLAVRLRLAPESDKLEEGRSLPLHRIVHAHLRLQEVLEKLEVCEKPAAQGSQAVEQERDVRVLVVLEELQHDLHDELRLLPVGVVHLVAFAMLLLVDGFIAPDAADRFDKLLLARDPAGAFFYKNGGETDGPVLDFRSVGGADGGRLLDAQLHQLIGAGGAARHHGDQLLGFLLQRGAEHFALSVCEQVFDEAAPLRILQEKQTNNKQAF